MTVQQGIDVEYTILPVSELDYDAFEVGVLAVARYFLIAMNAPETLAWQKAFTVSIERWGEQIGFPAAHLLSKLIVAVHGLRKDGFHFQDPLCKDAKQYVTEDENMLIEMLHHMRRKETTAARIAVEGLTLGRMDPQVIRTGLSFAARFSCGQQVATSTGPRPTLSVVQ